MLSRRNVRVKVMQQLYSLAQDKELTFDAAIRAFHNTIQSAYQLYLLNLYCLVRICSIAVEDARVRQNKHIKTDEDKVFTDKLYSNELIQSVEKNTFIQKEFKDTGFKNAVDEDVFRKVYKELLKEPSYNAYILKSDISKDEHIEMLLELYRCCRNNELFNEVMDDHFASWSDDKSLVIGALKKTLKTLPSDERFFDEHKPDRETVYDFGEFLLRKTYEESDDLDKDIEPILENWDSERVALIDMILIKMGVIELRNFKTIPCKVTLNEYVELSKIYSTEKSRDFVNGVLDKLLKDLQEKGLVAKEGRGLIDE